MSESETDIKIKECSFYLSECCYANTTFLDETIIKKTAPGVTSYYYEKCLKCSEPCHTRTVRMWDSDGTEIKPGDIIECTSYSRDHACRWHIAYIDHGNLTVRDLGHNNVGMLDSPYYNRGHYKNHPTEIFSEEDKDYYFGDEE